MKWGVGCWCSSPASCHIHAALDFCRKIQKNAWLSTYHHTSGKLGKLDSTCAARCLPFHVHPRSHARAQLWRLTELASRVVLHRGEMASRAHARIAEVKLRNAAKKLEMLYKMRVKASSAAQAAAFDKSIEKARFKFDEAQSRAMEMGVPYMPMPAPPEYPDIAPSPGGGGMVALLERKLGKLMGARDAIAAQLRTTADPSERAKLEASLGAAEDQVRALQQRIVARGGDPSSVRPMATTIAKQGGAAQPGGAFANILNKLIASRETLAAQSSSAPNEAVRAKYDAALAKLDAKIATLQHKVDRRFGGGATGAAASAATHAPSPTGGPRPNAMVLSLQAKVVTLDQQLAGLASKMATCPPTRRVGLDAQKRAWETRRRILVQQLVRAGGAVPGQAVPAVQAVAPPPPPPAAVAPMNAYGAAPAVLAPRGAPANAYESGGTQGSVGGSGYDAPSDFGGSGYDAPPSNIGGSGYDAPSDFGGSCYDAPPSNIGSAAPNAYASGGGGGYDAPSDFGGVASGDGYDAPEDLDEPISNTGYAGAAGYGAYDDPGPGSGMGAEGGAGSGAGAGVGSTAASDGAPSAVPKGGATGAAELTTTRDGAMASPAVVCRECRLTVCALACVPDSSIDADGFNELYQRLLDAPRDSPLQQLQVARDTHRLVRQFTSEASRCVFLWYWCVRV